MIHDWIINKVDHGDLGHGTTLDRNDSAVKRKDFKQNSACIAIPTLWIMFKKKVEEVVMSVVPA